ncbi:hypothetical protein GQ44DRAFT_729808 [Phaeosphaeriaceae sp. PMI808]|nr:hypothetical protein GQ44DRAFT_729808 [Phaeosphaeriaceae sp. PMI808]
MAVDWNYGRRQVAILTHDLRPSPTTSEDWLIAARKDVAIAIMAGETCWSQSVIDQYNLNPALSDMDQYDKLKPTANPIAHLRVFRRTIGLPSTWTQERPTLSHGPFLDLFDRQVYLDVFSPLTATAHLFVPDDPYMYLAAPLTGSAMYQQMYGAGKVWIAAAWFTRQADPRDQASADSFFALEFTSAITLSQPVTPAVRQITLKLDPTKSVSKLFGITPIAEVQFQFYFATKSSRMSFHNGGQISIMGSVINLGYRQEVKYDQSSIRFGLTLDNSALKLEPLSALADITGTSEVLKAMWSFPIQYVKEKRLYQPQSPMFWLALGGGLKFDIKGDAYPILLGECLMTLAPKKLVIEGTKGLRTSQDSKQIFLGGASMIYQDSVGSISINSPNKRNSDGGEALIYSYIALADGMERFTINMNLKVTFDQPRTVNNERVPVESITFSDNRRNKVSWIRDSQLGEVSMNIDLATMEYSTVSYALKNLLMKASVPNTVEIHGKYQQGKIVTGKACSISYLRYTLPILPDPYVTNFGIGIDYAAEKQGLGGHILMSSSWTQDTRSSLDVQLLSSKLTDAPVIERSREDDPQFADKRLMYYDEKFLIEKGYNNGLLPDVGVGSIFHPQNRSIQRSYNHPPTLLDVSSNGSQFGVVFSTQVPIQSAAPSPLLSTVQTFRPEDFRINSLMVHGTTKTVRVMALPATQWEPLVVEGKESPLSLEYSGPSTQIALKKDTPTVTLVPVAPSGAIDTLLGTYHGQDIAQLATRFTLPFGMVATALLPNKPGLFFPGKVEKANFQFTHGDPQTKLESQFFKPQDQLSFAAPRRLQLFPPNPGPSTSPSFQGITTLTKFKPGTTAAQTGQADIIENAADAFLNDMANKVPLTSFNLSGYGSSIFSDWRTVSAADTGISKVLINILNGRTSREIIVLDSIMAPFAVKVQKTVDIKRLDNGTIVRRISDWQALSEGRYQYKNPEIVTHMGVIRGVTDVRNIRATAIPTAVPLTDPSTEVVLTKFDCVLRIEDGGQVRQVPTRDLDGCIIITPLALDGTKGKKNYATILDSLELGGKTVDINIQIGTSGQRTRITSLGFKPTSDSPDIPRNVVAAAWGSPIFEGGGQWSFAKMAQDSLPELVDAAKGVPLVRNVMHNVADPRTVDAPFEFKDPEQLLKDAPEALYGIVHGAASHRVLFRNPKIPFVDGIKEIVPSEVFVADSFSLGKSTGVFPALRDCLMVTPDAKNDIKQALQILEGGYAFEPKKIVDNVIQGLDLDFRKDFERTLTDNAGVKTVVQTYSGIKGAADDVKSTMNLAINTAQNISKMNINNINLITSTVSDTAQKASTLVGRLNSDVNKLGGLLGKDLHLPDLPDTDPAKLLASPIHTFGPALAQIQKVISFLESLKFLPHFKVSVTNEWAMMMSTSMNREDLLKKIPAPSRPIVEKFLESFDFSLASRTSLSSFLLTLHVGVTIKIPTGFPPIVALAKGAFDVALGTGGIELKLDLGFGVGVDFSLGPFHVSASYTQSQTIIFHTDHWGVGITACMRAHIDLVIASADLYLEASLLLVGGECNKAIHDKPGAEHDQTTIWGFAKVRVAVHVSIFLICNISVDEEAHWENNFNGGPCLLQDMSDLPR